MPARPRKDIVDPDVPGFYHCTSRCVRRAFLCGQDNYTGRNYERRKEWLEFRLSFLASQMSIEVVGTAMMDNHHHAILRNRPDIAKTWSAREIARRWLTVCPGKRPKNPLALPMKPSDKDIEKLMKDKPKIAECRVRLASLSWMMKLLKEPFAHHANAEDSLTGTFFEGRFKSIRLLDLYALALCSMYVDLNPIRAGKAKTPETSTHTSAYRRIQARQARSQESNEPSIPADKLAAAWLTPIDEDNPPPDGPQTEDGRRISDRGFLPMSLEKYLMLLDWSGRELREDKRGAISNELATILDRLDFDAEHWLEGLQSFHTWFADFAGRPATLREFAEEGGMRWLRGMR